MISKGKRSSAGEMRKEAKAFSAHRHPVLKYRKFTRSKDTLECKTEVVHCPTPRSHNFLRAN